MRYFEQARADDSGRYWAVRVDAEALHVHEGAFGSPGQQTVEQFESSADAGKTALTRIAAQLRLGFREIVKAKDPRDLQPRQKRPEYRNGLEELILLEERMVELIGGVLPVPTRQSVDLLLQRYTDVIAADAQLLKGFLKRHGSTDIENDPDPELWREIKDEMHALVPLVMTLKDGDPASKPFIDALGNLAKFFSVRAQRTRARMVPKMYLALSEADLMDLGRKLRSRCKSTSTSTPAHGIVTARLRA